MGGEAEPEGRGVMASFYLVCPGRETWRRGTCNSVLIES